MGAPAIRISPLAAACIGAQATREKKLSAVRGELMFAPNELGLVLAYLSQDSDDEVRSLARQRLLDLSLDQLLDIVAPNEVHPRILDLIARCHFRKPELVVRLLAHPALAPTTAAFLAEQGEVAPSPVSGQSAPSDDALPLDEEEEYDEETEEHHNKYQLAQIMGVAEKIKMALSGDKEWRSILIRDSNKQVSGAVIKNPRITDGEVLTIAKSSIQNDEILRVICSNKEWVKNSQIRRALIENNRTPLQTALRYLSSLGEKDLASLAKSKNVSTVIATQARRMLLQKKKD